MPYNENVVEMLAELREFARWHADTANSMVGRLRSLGRPLTRHDWEAEFWALIEQRSNVRGLGANASVKLKAPMTDDGRNVNKFGPHLQRDGAKWDSRTERWVGGRPTPCTETYREAGERALARFDAEGITGDMLQNKLRLSDGSIVDGNQILKGKAAEEEYRDIRQELALQGRPSDSLPALPKPEEVLTKVGLEADRTRILRDCFEHLAKPGFFTVETWADVAYKLYQAPQRKNGSDAVIRTFLAAAAEYRLGRVPKIPHDIDLRAYTMSQSNFVEYIQNHDKRIGMH
ncbi:hypothetical protein [Nocardia sp. NPDC004750]